MFGRPSHIDTNYIDTNQIVEPGRSDKAAFDPQAYHRAMREGRSEGILHYVAAFFGGAILGMSFSFVLPFQARILIGLVAGVAFAFGLYRLRAGKIKKHQREAINLHAQTHELEATAIKLEIARAKASGAFDRWKQS